MAELPRSVTAVEVHEIIARRAAVRRREVLDACVEHLRDNGLITRQVSDIGELLDLAAGRGAFVRALGHTKAWAGAVSTARAVSPPSLDAWLAEHGLAGVAWLREWGYRAASLIASRPDSTVPVDSIVISGDVAPAPDTIGLLCALRFIDPRDTWSDDEFAPSPALERKDQFMQRMEVAWDRRADALGATPRKRALELHARWCARLVVGDSVQAIVADESAKNPRGIDPSTIRSAAKTFTAFIEAPNPLKDSRNLQSL